MTNQPSEKMLYSLQIGRALAAIAVVVQHTGFAVHTLFASMPDWLVRLFALGSFGVDYFFVLSGFIIAHVTYAMSPTLTDAKRFARSRAVRIYIPFWPISLLMVAVFAFAPSLSHGVREQTSLLAATTLLPSNAPAALNVAWTLQHEIVFYLVFGACFFLAKRRSLIFWWAAPIFIGRFFDLPEWTRFLLSPLNLEFLMGVAACWLYHHGRGFTHQLMLLVVGGSLTLLTMGLVFLGEEFPYCRLLIGLGFALVVLALVHKERSFDFGQFRAFVFLGAASYSIYLVHGPFVSVLLRVLHFIPGWLPMFLVFVPLAIAAGSAYHLFYEKPAMHWARQCRWIASPNERGRNHSS